MHVTAAAAACCLCSVASTALLLFILPCCCPAVCSRLHKGECGVRTLMLVVRLCCYSLILSCNSSCAALPCHYYAGCASARSLRTLRGVWAAGTTAYGSRRDAAAAAAAAAAAGVWHYLMCTHKARAGRCLVPALPLPILITAAHAPL
jgi:hypothetical protein